MANPAETQQPTSPPPQEEGPRSFAVFLRKLAQGEAESALSYEMHELAKKMQDEVKTRGEPVKGTMTLTLSFEAEPEDELVKIAYEVKTKPPKPKRAKGYFWLTQGGNLSSQQPKSKQTGFPFKDVASAAGVPHDLNPDLDEPTREV